MNTNSIYFPLCTFLLACLVIWRAIPFAVKHGLVDHPSSRRRHLKPMPMLGGVSILLAWLATGVAFFALNPQAATAYGFSFAVIAGGALVLCSLGLYDDLKGLRPWAKLPAEFLVALTVLMMVPELRAYCEGWQPRLGYGAWPLVAIWIVGVSNAINLVDGLDGLAGGISALILASIALLSWESGAALSFLVSATLFAGVVAFVLRNWTPASIFLGDNGSLPIGYLIAVTALCGPISTNSYVEVSALLAMLGYPILDMGMCTWRRLRAHNPIFKADRGHLHHRLLRMSLTPARVVTLILGLTTYLQISAFVMIELARTESMRGGFRLAEAFGLLLGLVAAGICVPIYFLFVVERARTGLLTESLPKEAMPSQGEPALLFEECLVARVDLQPLLESGLSEEKNRIEEVMRSLRLMVESLLGRGDVYFMKNAVLHIMFDGRGRDKERRAETSILLEKKLEDFQSLFGLQYSSSNLRVQWEVQDVLAEKGATKEADCLIQLVGAEAGGLDYQQSAL